MDLDLDALLAAIHAAPNLTGARCAGRSQLWDEQPRTAKGELNEARAIRQCRGCPALRDCAAWLATLPPSARPFGVVAGEVQHRARQREPSPPGPPMSRLRAAALQAIAEHERAAAQKAAGGRSDPGV